jgi:CheY-like chemotaxis protein
MARVTSSRYGRDVLPAPLRILLVEDDCDQQFLTLRAVERTVHPLESVHCASSGREAIAYMIGEGPFADRERHPFPSVVITDLNMPDGDGFEVLDFMRTNSAWCTVPRIVLTSSESDEDIRTAYRLGASAYHVKPSTLLETERQFAIIVAYWSTTHLPTSVLNGRVDHAHPQPRSAGR